MLSPAGRLFVDELNGAGLFSGMKSVSNSGSVLGQREAQRSSGGWLTLSRLEADVPSFVVAAVRSLLESYVHSEVVGGKQPAYLPTRKRGGLHRIHSCYSLVAEECQAADSRSVTRASPRHLQLIAV